MDGATPTTERSGNTVVSLYRRFRPGTFAELRGQPHVVAALNGAVKDGRIVHAYLFSGPRGTGKTSTARILAKALNCANPIDGEPCCKCPSCLAVSAGTSLDVHELDAASNNGVDAMRELVSHIALATPGRWKVYIVDEVHMLSAAAANALLKTLEEPPPHVIFVLATTDSQKVLPTIRSRTQHLEFGLLGADTLAGLVADVRAAAGLDVSDEALAIAVRKGRGSARDTLSALDQVAAAGGAAGMRPEVSELTHALCLEDANLVLVTIASLTESGWGAQELAGELVEELRQAFLLTLAPDLAGASGSERDRLGEVAQTLGLPRVVRAIEVLGRAQLELRDAPDPRALLEVALVRLARTDLDDASSALAERVARLERALAAGQSPASSVASPPPPDPAPGANPMARPGLGALRRQRAQSDRPTERSAPLTKDSAQSTPAPVEVERHEPVALTHDALVAAWGDRVLRSLPARAKALYSPGRFVGVEGTLVRFALPNDAHRDRCDEVKGVVEEALRAVFGADLRIELIVEGQSTSVVKTSAPAPAPGLDPDDDFDPDGPLAAGNGVDDAKNRVLEAFPGAEEVSG